MAPRHVTDFVRQLTPMAVEIGDRYGIDPALIITQAAIESGWGQEVSGNNYFGVKSHGQPGGQTILTHEEVNGKKVPVRDSFRTYDSLAGSMEDYAKFLKTNPRYGDVFKTRDLAKQVDAIANSGYATDSNYPGLLRDVSRMVQREMGPMPPAQIPNTVATQTDTQRPPVMAYAPSAPAQQMAGKSGAPTSVASRQVPTNWFTPRLAPGNTDIYAYRIPDQRNTDLVGGKGSLTPTIGQRDPIPMPRPRPSTAVAGFPTPRPTYTPSPAQRLPELPPSNLASPRVVTASIERANAAVDPGLKRALEQRVAAPAMIDTSMKRAANAVDPALQRALDAATRPAAPSMAKAPTGPALSRDSVAQGALGRETVQRLGTTPFSPSAPTLAAPALNPPRIPGPPAVIKTADALPAGVYPAMAPEVATALDVVPGIPLPRPRPVAPVTFAPVIKPVTGFPTAANLRPTAPLLAMTMPTQLAMRPPSFAPLKIAINGANSYSAPSTATPFQGAATGRTYVPGQQYVMNGQTYSAKQGGGFVNDKTGREVAKGTGWQALHGLN